MSTQNNHMPDVLKAEEVADMLRCSVGQVYEMARFGEIPSIRIGKRGVRFPTQAIETLLQGRNLVTAGR